MLPAECVMGQADKKTRIKRKNDICWGQWVANHFPETYTSKELPSLYNKSV